MQTASLVGQTLGHYRIVEKIGAGGMGEVYRGHDERLDRDVAIKVLPPETVSEGTARQKFLREGKALSRLNHPNIATVYDFGSHDGLDYLVMEFVVGETLDQKLKLGRLSEKETIRIGVQIARALEEAHENGVIHRDLKAVNVMVTPRGAVKVLDFGIATLVAAAHPNDETLATITTQHQALPSGTLPYMAPEVLRGEPGDERVDIWGLGVTLYQLATGKLPFQARSAYELTSAILEQDPVPLSPDISPALRLVIGTCLAKRKEDRYKHAGEVRAILETMLSSSSQVVVLESASRKHRLWMGIAAAVVLIAVVASIVLFLRLRRASELSEGGQLSLLMSTESVIDSPVVSPDGKMLVYAAEEGGHFDLFLSRIGGGGRIQLTNDADRESYPTFSADVEHIAFARRKSASAPSEICSMPTFGGDVSVLIQNATQPRYSPDGKRLAYIRIEPNQPTALVNAAVDGSDARVLLTANDVYPFLSGFAWSPNAELIAITRRTGGMAAELWVVPAKGGEPRRLTHDAPNIFSQAPAFTPDGKGVIHSSNRAGAANLWVAPIDGGAPVRLTSGTGPDDVPTVARDGTVVFVNSRWRYGVQLHDMASGNTKELARYSSYVWAPVFSPDGREVAYSYFENFSAWRIWIASVQGDGTPRRLTSGSADEIYSRFTPDGQAIFFCNWPGRGYVWRVPRQGGTSVKVTTQDGDSFADVSPDGKSIGFVRLEGGNARVYIASIDGGAARQLTTSTATLPRWSPDGKWILFAASRSVSGGLSVIRADGTGERKLTTSGSWAVWWPDGSKVAYLAMTPVGDQELRVVPFAGGESQTLSTLRWHGENYPFDISPDGKTIATTDGVHLQDDVWLMKPPK